MVLNWNGLNDTLECLDSIRNQTDKDFEIIVVDNGSSHEQKEHLRKISDIVLVDLPRNTGFTGGQIAALTKASGQYIALVNNDSVLSRDWSTKALELITSGSKIAAVGGRAYQWNEELNQKVFSKENSFYSYQVVHPSTGHCATLQTGNKTVSVSSISGAAVLIKRSVIDKVGYFDNRFFAYYEETDLFARMKRAGYQIMYSPELSVWHKVAQSTRSNPGFYLYFMHRNRFIFASKNYDLANYLSFLRYYFLTEWLGSIRHIIKKRYRSELEQRMMLKAGLWNIVHYPSTIVARQKAQKNGPTYSNLLKDDAQEDISIIIPNYNYEQYVAEAITSAANQSLQPSVITIIDDGSSDESLKIINQTIKSLRKSHKDIRFDLVSQANCGIVATKNRGIKEATTQWIVFLDADDILDKDYLKKCFMLQRKSNADVVYTDMQMFGAVNLTQTVLPYNKFRLRSVNFIHNSALYRTSLLRKVDGYSKEFSIGYEDWELNLKLSKITSRFSYLREPLLLYRRHDGASRDNNAQQKLVQVIKLLERQHPELYHVRYYWWLETIRAIDSTKDLIKYPFRIFKHTYFHTIMALDRSARHNTSLKRMMDSLRLLKKRSRDET